jgi:8-oxo-dGTP diphosphatase
MTTTAGGLLVNSRHQVLFGLRAAWKAAWPEHWDAIGGHIEPGEAVEDALVREISEEIGVTVTRADLLAVVENRGSGEGHTVHSHIVAVTSWIGEPRNICDEHSQLRWFSLDELSGLENLAGHGYPDLAREAISVHRAATR